jgi:hypothetical protein
MDALRNVCALGWTASIYHRFTLHFVLIAIVGKDVMKGLVDTDDDDYMNKHFPWWHPDTWYGTVELTESQVKLITKLHNNICYLSEVDSVLFNCDQEWVATLGDLDKMVVETRRKIVELFKIECPM